ncbi:MAG: glycosyltransferase family 9 protein [Acidobacteria bacterium]|nr:glycosyltransferase family 9 protein [Acidobacteriota bacterium]
MNVLAQLAEGSRVAVVRLRSLGDCVLTTPALTILKRDRPDLHISVVVEERFAAVFEGNPDVGAILPPSVKSLAQLRPELCLNVHGGTRSAVLTVLSRARFRAGFAHFRGGGIYNVPIPRAQAILGEERPVHTAEHLAAAMFYLGAARQPIPRARLFAEAAARRGDYAVLHATASAPGKTWPAARFLAVAGILERELRLQPVFIGGHGDDLSAFAGFERLTGAPLATVKSLLSGASLFIGNDSGPAHIAAAFGVPQVVIFGSSNPVTWAPWRVECQVLAGRPAITDISIDEVLEAASRLVRVPR